MEVKLHGGPNQTSVEKGGDDLWIGEKFQSNPEIAGSAGKRGTAQIHRDGPQVHVKWRRMWNCTDNQDVGSEAATHLKSA